MANEFLLPEQIVNLGLGMLRRQLILPRLVTQLGIADFVGSKDDTVTIRIPAILEAREYEFRTRNSAIVFDDVDELSIPVQLNKHCYSATKLTDEDLTLSIRDFGAQVLDPQIRAVAEKLESYIADAMDGGTYGTELDMTEGDADFDAKKVAIAARKALNVANVPPDGRVLVLGANIEAEFLALDHLTKVNEAGSPDALRNAFIGRLMGFDVVGNANSIDADTAYAFHPSAFAFANVAPVVPDGVVAGAGADYQGLAMRWIRDYDPTYLSDRSVVSSYAGAASINDARTSSGELTDHNVRAVKINFHAGS